jgi:hypothetical protein
MMEVDSAKKLPTPWHELSVARTLSRSLREDVEKLRSTCETEDSKNHVVECDKCYRKILERIQERYTGTTENNWFSDRQGFKIELEAQLQAAKEGEESLSNIETNIELEKQAWYRKLLQNNIEILELGDSEFSRDELLSTLADLDRPIADVIAQVWEALGSPEKWTQQVDGFVDKVTSAGTDAEALKKLYAAHFFRDHSSNEVLENAQPYLEGYENGQKGGLEDVLQWLMRDLSSGKATQAQRTLYRKRLDELSRAKTAFEQNKAQAKGRTRDAQEPAVATDLASLPPCHVCQRSVDRKDTFSCSLCQAMLQLASAEVKEKRKLTVYCSQECFYEGHVWHPLAPQT